MQELQEDSEQKKMNKTLKNLCYNAKQITEKANMKRDF